jgi:hypothetical protein
MKYLEKVREMEKHFKGYSIGEVGELRGDKADRVGDGEASK